MNPQKIYGNEKNIIIGGSEVGELLARRLKMHGRFAIIVENYRFGFRICIK